MNRDLIIAMRRLQLDLTVVRHYLAYIAGLREQGRLDWPTRSAASPAARACCMLPLWRKQRLSRPTIPFISAAAGHSRWSSGGPSKLSGEPRRGAF